jgi:hypothetical protein
VVTSLLPFVGAAMRASAPQAGLQPASVCHTALAGGTQGLIHFVLDLFPSAGFQPGLCTTSQADRSQDFGECKRRVHQILIIVEIAQWANDGKG